MSFTFNCPHCNQKLEAEDSWVGQVADCPVCGGKISIAKPIISASNAQSNTESQVSSSQKSS